MKTAKKLITIVMIAGLAVAFVGCGGADREATVKQPETIAFETMDTEGNKVSSEELFAANKVTMVNFWGTFCGPCIQEMPEIEKISQEYADKGGGVIGVLVDVTTADDKLLGDAKAIEEDTKVTYRSVLGWDGFAEYLPEGAVPITYFVDSQGKILEERIVGADPDGYREVMDRYLK